MSFWGQCQIQFGLLEGAVASFVQLLRQSFIHIISICYNHLYQHSGKLKYFDLEVIVYEPRLNLLWSN